MAKGMGYAEMAEALQTTQEAVDGRVTELFRRLADEAGQGESRAVDELKRLHEAVVDREASARTLRSFVPSQVAERLAERGAAMLQEELGGHRALLRHPGVLDDRAAQGALGVVRERIGRAEDRHTASPWNLSIVPPCSTTTSAIAERCRPTTSAISRAGSRSAIVENPRMSLNRTVTSSSCWAIGRRRRRGGRRPAAGRTSGASRADASCSTTAACRRFSSSTRARRPPRLRRHAPEQLGHLAVDRLLRGAERARPSAS